MHGRSFDGHPTGREAHSLRARGWAAAGALAIALTLQACGGGGDAVDAKPLAAAPVSATKVQSPSSTVQAVAAAAATAVDLLAPDRQSAYRIEEVGDGTLRVTLSVGDGVNLTGDIRAFYFHMNGNQSQGLVVSGDMVTGFTLGANTVTQAGGRDTKLARTSGVAASGGFDVGVEIGTRSATGADDVQSTAIVLSRPGGLTLADFRYAVDSAQGPAYLGLVAGSVGAPGARRRDAINSVFEPDLVLPPPPPPARVYDVGAAHLCLGTPQLTQCVGDNTYGQSPLLGSSYVLSARQVAAGERHSCGLGVVLVGGTTFVPDSVACWGANATGATVLLPQPSLGPVAQIAAGNDTTCALTQAGEVRCWAATTDAGALNAYTVAGLGAVIDLAVGSSRACAVDSAGVVRCWHKDSGADAGGLAGASPIVQVDAFGGVACGADAAGGALCWGIADAQVMPGQPPSTLTGVTQVAVGNNFACAAATGGVACWGTNLLPPDPRVLVIPADLTDVRNVEAGGDTVCAERRATGEVVCWGAINRTFSNGLPE